jgi:DNA-binding CsgD family transcriptional regulator
MDHLLILFDAVTLFVGALAAVYAHQMYRSTGRPYLKSLVHYIIFFNFAVLVFLVTRYLWTNLFGPDKPTAHLFLALVSLSIFVAGAGRAYTFLKITCGFEDKDLSPLVKRLFILGILVFGAGYLVGWRLYIETGSARGIGTVNTGLSLAVLAVTLAALTVLAVGSRSGLTAGRNAVIRGFTALFFAGYILYAASIFLPRSVGTYATPVVLLLLNLCPLVWLNRFFLKHDVPVYPKEGGEALDAVTHEFNISKREREVMELLLQGKRNKEIEKELFISGSTVKNHIYNLYQKLGVKSRVQLIHLVMKSQHL